MEVWHHEPEYLSLERKQTTGKAIIRDENGLCIGKVIAEDAPLIAEAPAMLEFIAQISRMATQREADGADMGNDLAMDGLIARSRAILARIDGEA